ncbi:MAG: helix-turn-helix domain-containing protein [Bacteroidota bacterium]
MNFTVNPGVKIFLEEGDTNFSYFHATMEGNINEQVVRDFLKKVGNDDLFVKAPRYFQMLEYLVEKALKGDDLKEQTIGLELFEQDYSESKNSGIVRVYMYNLRKRLKKYYEGTGKHDAIKFLLEKGSYNLKFIAQDVPSVSVDLSKPVRFFSTAWVWILLLVIGTSAIVFYFKLSPQKIYLWDHFFDPATSTLCVMADQTVLQKKNGPQGEFVTRREVNNPDEFIAYTHKFGADSFTLAEFTFFTRAIPYSIYRLTRWFSENEREFSLTPESELRFKDSGANNVIYIGQSKTMSVSRELFLKNSKWFKDKYRFFESSKGGKVKKYRSTFRDGGIRVEYAMVSFMPLENGNKGLYFVSNHDIGTMATVSQFTDPEFLNEFYQSLPSKDAYFNALFRVEGIDRTDVDCKLVELELIEP